MMQQEKDEILELLDKLKEFNCSSFEELDEKLNPKLKKSVVVEANSASQPIRGYKRSLTLADVRSIRRRHYNGESRHNLSEHYNVSFSIITDIIHRKLWANSW